MIEKILVQIIEIILVAIAAAGIAVVLAATWHDVHAIARRARLRIPNANPPKAKQPLVSILIYARDSAATIQDCLDSITASDYERYKIVVVNNASTDTTIAAVSNFKKAHQDIPLATLTLKVAVDRHTALRIASKKAVRSDFVCMIDAATMLSTAAITRSIAYFLTDRRVEVLQIRQHQTGELSIKNLAENFILLSRNVATKALFWKPIINRQLHYQGVILRGSTLASVMPKSRLRTSYSGATTYTSSPSGCDDNSVRSHSMTLAWIITLLTCLGLMTYFFYTAATLQSNTFLTLSWTLVSLWLFAVVWSDEALSLRKKIGLTFTIPFTYFLLYAQLFITFGKTAWWSLSCMNMHKLDFKNIHSAIMQEAYSTRF